MWTSGENNSQLSSESSTDGALLRFGQDIPVRITPSVRVKAWLFNPVVLPLLVVVMLFISAIIFMQSTLGMPLVIAASVFVGFFSVCNHFKHARFLQLNPRACVCRSTFDIAKDYSWDRLIAVRYEKFFPQRIERLWGAQPVELLCLHFADVSFEIPWWKLKAQQREQVFLALTRFAAKDVFSKDALHLQSQTLLTRGHIPPDSFTQMWLEDFQNKFELVNYAPLVSGTAVVERYTVIMPLSVRGTTATYLASTGNGDRVVLKEIVISDDLERPEQAKVLEQFDREAAILAKLNHPQIVSILDHFISNGRSYIVMNVMAGTNLRQHVQSNGALPEGQVRAIGRQLTELLVYLHGQNPPVIHRDITPDNVLFDPATGSVSLVDFGAANLFLSKGTATLIGKQNYMPPEQFRGKAEPASDRYGFGATIYFLLAGKDPRALSNFGLPEATAASQDIRHLLTELASVEPASRPDWAEIKQRLIAVGERSLA